MTLLVIGLVVLQFFTAGLAFYLYKLPGKKYDEVKPYNQFYIGLGACAFGLSMLFLFYVFVSPEFNFGENLGQVGDFVGGLTNPALSFMALIVLLRTTLIQTEEARKTSTIMLDQQKLMQEERFETTFYTLLERYEASAESYLRVKVPKDKLTYGLRALQDLRKQRAEFDAKTLKECLPALKSHINSELRLDRFSKTIARAWKVFDFIDGSSLPDDRKKYYFSIFYDAMEPCEMVLLITRGFTLRKKRKKLRKYSPGSYVKPQFFACAAIGKYFGSKFTDSAA
ncbi:putative Phage abortive infection protein [Pseudomonas donghuensis]|uniref:hypothetical protein n=1 Tax=Pseudomonas donghuensis TaxID=1163398 RepID=UPI0039DFF8D4